MFKILECRLSTQNPGILGRVLEVFLSRELKDSLIFEFWWVESMFFLKSILGYYPGILGHYSNLFSICR